MSFKGATECEKPDCTNSPDKTYKGKHGNTLQLCLTHYYLLVKPNSGGLSTTGGISSGTTDPFSLAPGDVQGPLSMGGEDRDE